MPDKAISVNCDEVRENVPGGLGIGDRRHLAHIHQPAEPASSTVLLREVSKALREGPDPCYPGPPICPSVANVPRMHARSGDV
jgi:hypothetical protein